MLSAARRLAARPQAARAFATAVEAKVDWSDLSSRVHSDEAKREVAKLKKLFDDTREMLAAQAKVRTCRTPAVGGNPTRGCVQRPVRPSRRPPLLRSDPPTGCAPSGVHAGGCSGSRLCAGASGHRPGVSCARVP